MNIIEFNLRHTKIDLTHDESLYLKAIYNLKFNKEEELLCLKKVYKKRLKPNILDVINYDSRCVIIAINMKRTIINTIIMLYESYKMLYEDHFDNHTLYKFKFNSSQTAEILLFGTEQTHRRYRIEVLELIKEVPIFKNVKMENILSVISLSHNMKSAYIKFVNNLTSRGLNPFISIIDASDMRTNCYDIMYAFVPSLSLYMNKKTKEIDSKIIVCMTDEDKMLEDIDAINKKNEKSIRYVF